MNYLKFVQMLSSRLCHDLITPIGAVNTGIELLHECHDQDYSQLLNICQHSAETASRRLVYYRAAFGYAATSQITDFDKLETIITRFLLPLNIKFSWPEKPFLTEMLKNAIDLPLLARLILNIILIQAECASAGGHIELKTKINNTYFELFFKIDGKLSVLRQEIQDAVSGLLANKDISPHTIQAVMTAMLLEEYTATIAHIKSTNSECTLHVVKNLNDHNLQQSNSNDPAVGLLNR